MSAHVPFSSDVFASGYWTPARLAAWNETGRPSLSLDRVNEIIAADPRYRAADAAVREARGDRDRYASPGYDDGCFAVERAVAAREDVYMTVIAEVLIRGYLVLRGAS